MVANNVPVESNAIGSMFFTLLPQCLYAVLMDMPVGVLMLVWSIPVYVRMWHR